MSAGTPLTVSAWAGGPEFAPLLERYVVATEIEKGTPAASLADLPDRFHDYVANPAAFHERDDVLIAHLGERPVGCAIVTEPADGASEIKRLWVEPDARRTGAGRALLMAAISTATGRGATTARLSVWHWRTGAIALYRSVGFVEVPTWDERDGLICMAKPLAL